MKYLTEPLNKVHIKTSFSCGQQILDQYIKYQASQDIRKKLAVCFVLTDHSGIVSGYYTLSNSSIPLENLPEKYKKKIPSSYKAVPSILLGRLAVSMEYQGSGYGELLLIDAIKRCLEISKALGSFAVIVDPINAKAVDFYLKYGFIRLPDSGKMLISMKMISQRYDMSVINDQ